jgi:hypothetical protein
MGWNIQCLTYMGEHIKVIEYKYKSLFGILERSKHDCEVKISKEKAQPINAIVCMFIQKI